MVAKNNMIYKVRYKHISLINPDFVSPNAKTKLLVDVHNISQEQRLLKLKHVSGKVLILHHLLLNHCAYSSH